MDEILRPVIKSVRQYKAEEVNWLWPQRFPADMLSILVGDPGRAKSYFTIDLACRLAAGLPLPDTGEPSEVKGKTLFMICEDSGSVLRGRQIDMGHEKIDFDIFECFQDSDGNESMLSLDKHMDELDYLLAENDYRLLIIDPLMAALGAIDSYNDGQVRNTVLAPLSRLATKHKVAILLVTHLNKKVGISSLYRVGGSIGFVAAARSVWEALEDHTGPDQCSSVASVLRSVKNNLCRPAEPLGIGVDDDGAFHYYELDDAKREKLSSGSGTTHRRNSSKMGKAKAIWESLLAKGPKPVAGLTGKLSKKHRISTTTLDRARRELGIRIGIHGDVKCHMLPKEKEDE